MTWLKDNAGLLCIAAGWALAFTAWLIKPDEMASMLMVCATALMGFGIGWIVRGEGGGDD